jgi:hypothetical protein
VLPVTSPLLLNIGTSTVIGAITIVLGSSESDSVTTVGTSAVLATGFCGAVTTISGLVVGAGVGTGAGRRAAVGAGVGGCGVGLVGAATVRGAAVLVFIKLR